MSNLPKQSRRPFPHAEVLAREVVGNDKNNCEGPKERQHMYGAAPAIRARCGCSENPFATDESL